MEGNLYRRKGLHSRPIRSWENKIGPDESRQTSTAIINPRGSARAMSTMLDKKSKTRFVISYAGGFGKCPNSDISKPSISAQFVVASDENKSLGTNAPLASAALASPRTSFKRSCGKEGIAMMRLPGPRSPGGFFWVRPLD